MGQSTKAAFCLTDHVSAFASCGQSVAYALARCVPILLQKSFSTADQNFSRPLVRFSESAGSSDPNVMSLS